MSEKYYCKCKIDKWENEHLKDSYSYYIDSKKIDIDFIDTLFSLLENSKTSVDREYLKKYIDEI